MNRRDFLAAAGFSAVAICGGCAGQLTDAPRIENIDAVYKGFQNPRFRPDFLCVGGGTATGFLKKRYYASLM